MHIKIIYITWRKSLRLSKIPNGVMVIRLIWTLQCLLEDWAGVLEASGRCLNAWKILVVAGTRVMCLQYSLKFWKFSRVLFRLAVHVLLRCKACVCIVNHFRSPKMEKILCIHHIIFVLEQYEIFPKFAKYYTNELHVFFFLACPELFGP